MGILHQNISHLWLTCWFLLRIRSVSNKRCRENQNTYFMFSNFFRKSCCIWDNVDKYDGARGATNDVLIWRMRAACWIDPCTRPSARAYTRKHSNTRAHTQIRNIHSFSTPSMIGECASMLRYTYIVCLVAIVLVFLVFNPQGMWPYIQLSTGYLSKLDWAPLARLSCCWWLAVYWAVVDRETDGRKVAGTCCLLFDRA